MIKKTLQLLIVLFNCNLMLGQTVPSSCVAAPNIVSFYRDDADRLSVKRIIELNSNYIDSVNIPVQYDDTLLNALLAVYNATTLPERNDVVNTYNIHTFPNIGLRELSVAADSNLIWMQQLRNNVIPTGNTSVDNLISQYNLQVTNYTNYFNSFYYHVVRLGASSNYNIQALANRFDTINGVNYAERSNVCCDGSDIQATITPSYTELLYSYGWDDCQAGCINKHFWKFRVYSDCSVEFVQRYGSPISGFTSIKQNENEQTKLFPNPFINQIKIDGANNNSSYKLINSLGEIVAKGKIINSTILNLENISSGIYNLIIYSDSETKNFKIIK